MEEDKKPRGHFAQEVKRISTELAELREEYSEIRDVLTRYPELIKLLEHPLIVNYKYMDQKIKRIEQVVTGFQNRYTDIERQLLRATNLVAQAEQLAKRGS